MGPTTRARALDALALTWVVVWVVAALLLGSATWGLGSVTDSARSAASVADQAGKALEDLGGVPLVPDAIGERGTAIRDQGASIDAQALSARSSIHRVAVGLGVAVFAAATAPVWLVHLPLRARRRRTARSVLARLDGGRAGSAPGRDPTSDRRAMTAYLAHRAVATMPPTRLLALSADPAGDLAAGRHDALARAELERLGIDAHHLDGPRRHGAPAADGATAMPQQDRPGSRW